MNTKHDGSEPHSGTNNCDFLDCCFVVYADISARMRPVSPGPVLFCRISHLFFEIFRSFAIYGSDSHHVLLRLATLATTTYRHTYFVDDDSHK